MEHPPKDITIIGAGPAGLFALFYAGMRQASAQIVDALPEAGGQLAALYPEKYIFDVAGYPQVLARDLVKQLVEQAGRFGEPIHLGQRVTGLERHDGEFVLHTEKGDFPTKAIIVAAGIGAFSPRRLPQPCAAPWYGRGIHDVVTDPKQFAGQRVVIVGGGDSAFDWVLALHPVAASVTLVHRRAKFRAAESIVRQARELGTRIITDAEVTRFVEDANGALEAVDVSIKGAGEERLPANAVVAALGFTADLGPIESWGLEIDHRAIAVDSTMATARERVYAAGDVAAYPGKVKLIATGFGEAATAVNNIAVALDPDAHLFPGHSSNAE